MVYTTPRTGSHTGCDWVFSCPMTAQTFQCPKVCF
uniref:Uncharacterized protein n=1 Tax=Anguilla anguilla TaxID=7936 RepID=A0A0E9PJS5_ANGAN